MHVSVAPHYLQHLAFSVFCNFANRHEVKVSHCDLICISLMTNNVSRFNGLCVFYDWSVKTFLPGFNCFFITELYSFGHVFSV